MNEMPAHSNFIVEVLEEEVRVLNDELHEWKLNTITPAKFLYKQGKPEYQVETIRKRISKLDICIDILKKNKKEKNG